MLTLLLALTLPLPAAAIVMTIGADGRDIVASAPAEPINLDVVDADIRTVLRLFGEHAGLNFVIDDSVQATVTARLIDVPWDEALAAILAVEGLVAVPMAPEGDPPSVYRVEPIVEAR